MPQSRSGHHGDVGYAFEPSYNTAPSSPEIKVFGSNATMDTFEGGRQAERKYNASRRAAEIISQNFDGGWGVSFELSEPPWWLAAAYGQPASTNVAESLYDHTYDLDNGNDPVPLRLYAPTEGYNDYYVVPGCWLVSVSVDQSENGSPEISLTGGYADEPIAESGVDTSIPDFSTSTYSNRDAELQVDGDTVGRVQTTTLSLETGAEGVSEIGTDSMVDFTTGAFEPSITYDKIRFLDETVDFLDRFGSEASVAVNLKYDNGETDDSQYVVTWEVIDSFPDSWSESGRNDPDARLEQELQDMGRDARAIVTVAQESPPGV